MVFRYDFAVPHEESNDTSDDETTQDDRTAAMSGSDSPAPARGGSNQRHFADSLESPGDEIGPYKLISQIGEGGFGTVWLAQRRHPFTQRVALKVIKAGMDSKSVLARFDQERQALAVMDHPNIAKVLDGGMTKSGRPYFAMEFVKGEPITEFCDKHKLTITERLKLFEKACEAIQHAHLKGIIHRDIKPGNIIAFATEGAAPGLKVIDFGIAKATSHLMSANTVYTETGQMIGTPDYMSPEQACSTSADVDTRTDIYSLGVLLYELLTGALPFDPKHLRSKAYREIQRIVQEDEPPSPSARLSAIATKERELASKIEKCRKIATAELVRNLRRELEWIPLMAMRKEPRNRYQTAISLADDIRNYLNGAPLVAAPESRMYRLRKTAKRHRALVTGMAAVLLTLVVGLSLATWQWRVATNERIAADSARDGEREQRTIAEASGLKAQEALAQLTAGEIIASTGRGLAAAQDGNQRVAAQEAKKLEKLGAADRITSRLLRAYLDEPLPVIHEFGASSKFLAISATGGIIALRESILGSTRVVETTKGQIKATFFYHLDGEFSVACFSPDGSIMATTGADHAVRLWTVKDSEQRATLVEKHPPSQQGGVETRSFAFSADGSAIAVGCPDGKVGLWDSSSGAMLALYAQEAQGAQPITSIAFSPSLTKRTLAAGSMDGTLTLWNRDDGMILRTHKLGSEVRTIAFSSDGNHLATMTRAGDLVQWDAGAVNRQYNRSLPAPKDVGVASPATVAFSPDSSMLAAANGSGVCFQSTTSPRYLGCVATPTPVFETFAFEEDGRTIVTIRGQTATNVRRCELSSYLAMDSDDGSRFCVKEICVSLDGHSTVCEDDGRLVLFDHAMERCTVVFAGDFSGHGPVALSPDGTSLAVTNEYGGMTIYDCESGEQRESWAGTGTQIDSISFSSDGTRLAMFSKSELSVRLWNRKSRQLEEAPWDSVGRLQGRTIESVQFTPISSVLMITTLVDGKALLEFWDCEEPAKHWTLDMGSTGARVAAFSPDGKTIAVKQDLPSPHVQLRDVSDGSLRATISWVALGTSSFAFCGDGKTVACLIGIDSLQFWDRETGEHLAEFKGAIPHWASCIFQSSATSRVDDGDGQIRNVWLRFPDRDKCHPTFAARTELKLAAERLAPALNATQESAIALAALRAKVLADPNLVGTARQASMIVITAAQLKAAPGKKSED